MAEIEVPVDLYHGQQDRLAPYSYARYLDEKLPHSNLHLFPAEGHLLVMKLLGRVFEEARKANADVR